MKLIDMINNAREIEKNIKEEKTKKPKRRTKKAAPEVAKVETQKNPEV